jgi:hypothetical protein
VRQGHGEDRCEYSRDVAALLACCDGWRAYRRAGNAGLKKQGLIVQDRRTPQDAAVALQNKGGPARMRAAARESDASIDGGSVLAFSPSADVTILVLYFECAP